MMQLETQSKLAKDASVFLAFGELADAIQKQQEYTSLVKAYTIMNSDSETQQLLQELRAWQRRGILAEEQADFEQRLEQFYGLPTVVDYYATESALKDILRQVDNIISEIAGLDFAANARRGCCGD